jgi:hypothetical protein
MQLETSVNCQDNLPGTKNSFISIAILKRDFTHGNFKIIVVEQ